MSAGVFTIASYEADYGAGTAVHGCKVQPETIAATCASTPNQVVPGPSITNPISAMVSSSTRSLGLHARIVRLKNPLAPPATYSPNSNTQIPALSKAFFIACSLPGASVTYLGTSWEVAGTRAEKAR